VRAFINSPTVDPSLVGSNREFALSGHRDNVRTQTVGFVGGGHDHVALSGSIQANHLSDFIPRHELDLIFVPDVVLVGSNASGVDVQADHASNQVVADLLLPGFLRSGQGDLYISWTLVLGQLDGVLGVVGPGQVLLLGLELLVVEMAPSSRSGLPLSRDDLVLRIF